MFNFFSASYLFNSTQRPSVCVQPSNLLAWFPCHKGRQKDWWDHIIFHSALQAANWRSPDSIRYVGSSRATVAPPPSWNDPISTPSTNDPHEMIVSGTEKLHQTVCNNSGDLYPYEWGATIGDVQSGCRNDRSSAGDPYIHPTCSERQSGPVMEFIMINIQFINLSDKFDKYPINWIIIR